MANQNDIIPKKAIDGIIATDTELIKLDQTTLNFIKTVELLNTALKKGGIDFKALSKAQKTVIKTTNELTQVEKQQTKTEKELARQKKAGIKLIEKQNLKLAQEEAAIKKVVKSEDDLIKKTNALVAVRRRLDKTTDSGKAKHKQLTAEINRNTNALKRQDAQIGRNQRNVGNYGSALKGVGTQLLGALGITAGITVLVSVLRGAFQKLAAFSQANATLAATLGKTRDEIEDLTESAIAFGKTTKFTAVEVSKLQNELAKLGFTTGEIKLQTDAVLKLAEATGADLADAAKVTGIALKAYGLSAIEATRVASVLAIATTKSALSFADFETALSTVGPVAKAFGFSLEDTIALMGKLRDAGFDSSKSSTALRNILLNLADSNGALAKKLGGSVTSLEEFIPAMVKLRASGVDLNETLQLTDKRSVAAFNTLLEGADDVLVLRDAITDVNDALDEMVNVKTDNTIDAMARLGSAWDGVVLSFRNSEGFFVGFFDGLSSLLNITTDKYISFGDKILILSGSLGGARVQSEIAVRQSLLKSIEKLDEEELKLLIARNVLKAIEGDEFSKDLIKQADERIEAIKEANELGIKREEQSVIDGLAIIKKANEDFANEKIALDKLTTSLFLSEEEKKLVAIDTRAEKLREKGVDEVSIARFVAQEKKKITDEAAKKEQDAAKKTADEKIKISEGFIAAEKIIEKSWIEALRDLKEEETQILKDEFAKQLDLRKANADEALRIAMDNIAKQEEIDKEVFALKMELGKEAAAAAFSIFSSGLDRQMIANETQRENELLLAGDDKEKQAEINKKFDREQAAIKTKQAKADKVAAMVNIAINTAIAITQAFAQAGPIAGIPLAVLMGAIGAVQLAAVVAQPIPKFFKGTENAPEGLISVGEKGRELIETKSGKRFMANNPTITSGLKGAKIYTNKETEQIMRGAGYDSIDVRSIVESNKEITRAIKNIPQPKYDKDNRTITERKGRYFKTYLNTKMGKW